MTLEDKMGYCFASQDIRNKARDGKILGSSIKEEQIQPSSFDPRIGNEAFILFTENRGIFRPKRNESIYRTILNLPKRFRQRVDISNGFEIKKGSSYLIPLEEKIILEDGEYIKSSPKSSFGRLFLNTRMVTDYNPCINEISSAYKVGEELQLWLLVQPLMFNTIIHPGLQLNQLRFFRGDARLNPYEIMEEFKKSPLLCNKDNSPAVPHITDGLQIHLDISGDDTDSIVGLRAIHNPFPIDLDPKKIGMHGAESYFEPIISKNSKSVNILKGEYYIFSSKEILKIPSHLSAELRSNSDIAFSGPLHFAGFIDNGFEGDLVCEIRSDEQTKMELDDGTPLSKLDIFRSKESDKVYGESIGSSYKGQTGPRLSKYFEKFDYSFAARNYKKLERLVLVQDAKELKKYRKNLEGFELIDENLAHDLCKCVEDGFFQSRYDCESDELILQPIPYVLLLGPNKTIFSYVRASNIKDYGDARLFGKHSIGVGGHIIKSDAPSYIDKCIEREVLGEEVLIEGKYSKPALVGTLMRYDTPVDRVHFGLVFAMHVDGNVKPKELALVSGCMENIEKIVRDSLAQKKYETWSRVLIPNLDYIYAL